MGKIKLILTCLILAAMQSYVISQTRTVGLIQSDTGVYEGYTLLAPASSSNDWRTFLLDNCGNIVHEWPTTGAPGVVAYFLPNGNLLRTAAKPHPYINAGGRGGKLQIWDWDGNKIWDYLLSDSTQTQHHDAVYMPNGNVLALVWCRKDSVESIANGRDTLWLTQKSIWSEKLMEIRPIGMDSGEVVWEWDNWDHLVQDFDSTKANYGNPSAHPELWDLNSLEWSGGGSDWLHANGIDYNAALDQIAISCRYMHEVYIIDHSTTTAEAASHTGGNSGKGGDILFRWGNPEIYGRGVLADRKLFAQHNVHWIADSLKDAGKLMIFNNGSSRFGGEYSSVDIIDPMPDSSGNYSLNVNNVYGPDSAEWSYSAPNRSDFHSQYIAGAERLPNGNTIICDGTHGTIFEIDTNKNTIWKYISPVTSQGIISQGDALGTNPAHGTNNWVFRAQKFGASYPGLTGKTLMNLGTVELNPLPSFCSIITGTASEELNNISVFPNPVEKILYVRSSIDSDDIFRIKVLNVLGQTLQNAVIPAHQELIELDLNYRPGIYFVEISNSIHDKKIFRIVKQ